MRTSPIIVCLIFLVSCSDGNCPGNSDSKGKNKVPTSGKKTEDCPITSNVSDSSENTHTSKSGSGGNGSTATDSNSSNSIGDVSVAISTQRYDISAAVVGNRVLFAGGYPTTNGGDKLEIFDALMKSWLPAQSIRARHTISALSIGNVAMFAGGMWSDSDHHYTSDFDIYDCRTNTCTLTSNASMPNPRMAAVATSIAGKAIFAGGYNNGASAAVDIFDTVSMQWLTSSSLSVPRGRLTAVTLNNKAIFAGGYDNANNPLSIVDVYDCSNGCSWTTGTLSIARAYLAGTSVGNKAFFAGGLTSNNSSSKTGIVDVYECTTSCSWTTATLPSASGVMRAVTVGAKAIFIDAEGRTDIYDGTTNTWRSSSIRPNPSSSPVLVPYGSKILVGGGFFDGGRFDVFDTVTETWSGKF
jgi:hypothetical protein